MPFFNDSIISMPSVHYELTFDPKPGKTAVSSPTNPKRQVNDWPETAVPFGNSDLLVLEFATLWDEPPGELAAEKSRFLRIFHTVRADFRTLIIFIGNEGNIQTKAASILDGGVHLL
jgi:hypothetical protein